MKALIQRFKADEDGATAIEYSLMIALVGIAIISALDLAGDAVAGVFQTISLELTVAGEGSAVPDTGPGDSGSGGSGSEGAGDDLDDGGAHGEEPGDD